MYEVVHMLRAQYPTRWPSSEASASRAEDPGFKPCFSRGVFPGPPIPVISTVVLFFFFLPPRWPSGRSRVQTLLFPWGFSRSTNTGDFNFSTLLLFFFFPPRWPSGRSRVRIKHCFSRGAFPGRPIPVTSTLVLFFSSSSSLLLLTASLA